MGLFRNLYHRKNKAVQFLLSSVTCSSEACDSPPPPRKVKAKGEIFLSRSMRGARRGSVVISGFYWVSPLLPHVCASPSLGQIQMQRDHPRQGKLREWGHKK